MTREPAPVRPPAVLTIAGSDSGGGAGVQADLKTIEAGGAFGTSAITGVTAQHTRGVESTHGVPPDAVAAQIDAVVKDIDVTAAKTGMLGTAAVVETVTERAPDLPNLVVDPVMVASSGDRLLDADAEDAYDDLLEHATLATPNADEAAVLTDVAVEDRESAQAAGEALLETGVDAALVKGGHVPGDDVVDTLVTGESVHTFRHDRIEGAATHGSGCTLSSAIATRLAHGDDLPAAVGEGVDLLASAVRYHLDVGQGPGAVHHTVAARNEAARETVTRDLGAAVGRLVRSDADAILPAHGGNVAGATPYAESPADVAAVDGGVVPSIDGPRPAGGIRFGAAGELATVLLAVRERDAAVRFAARLAAAGRAPALDGPVPTVPEGADGGTHRRAAAALAGTDEPPVAIAGVDGPDDLILLGESAVAVVDDAIALADAEPV